MKKLLILGAVAVLTLTGCSVSAPAPTVTVTAEPDSGSSSGGSSSSSSKTEDFIMYMGVAGIPSYMLEGEALSILIDQAKTTCGYIDDGDSKDDIIWMLTLAHDASGTDQAVMDAFIAASVAATYVYCPEYAGFWE